MNRQISVPSICGLLLLSVLSAALFATRSTSPEIALGGLAIIWISAIPGLLYLTSPRQSAVPLMPITGLYYLIFFGLSVFLARFAYMSGDRIVIYRRIVLDPIGLDVLALAALGIAAMLAAFYAAQGTIFRGLGHFRLIRPIRTDVLNALYWLLIAASMLYHYVPALHAIPSIGQFLDPAGYLAIGGLHLQWHARALSKWQSIAFYFVCLPLDIIWRSQNFFITEMLWLSLLFAFVLWRTRQFKTLAAIGALGLILATSYNASIQVRHMGTGLVDKGVAIANKIADLLDVHERESVPGYAIADLTFDRRLSPLAERIGHIWIFQTVFERTPEPVPYLHGETYKPLLTSAIPRILYPDKPKESLGAEFGYRYGFTEDKEGLTSFNVPWMTELLVNFGPPGVLIGMGIFGILLAFLDRVFNNARMNDVEFMVGLTILFKLCYQESNFSVMTGSLPMLFVCLWIYFNFGPRILARFFKSGIA